MCMTNGCNPPINFATFSQFSSDLVIVRLKAYRHWTTFEPNQILLQFYLELFETLRLFLSRSEDTHVIRSNMDFLL